MQGFKDPFNRKFFDWDNIDYDILNSIKELSLIRNNNSLFKDANIHFVYLIDGFVSFVRYKDDEEILISVNANNTQVTFFYNDNEYVVEKYSYSIINLCSQ